ncbi:winged helix-turn-helix domain-containing protein [Streptomyces sp. V1I6]|uniref:helix-turn-helix domain-containing protein n=1 Tax=Streptomyces sp. V1I6 TaxID=3042273 RepID=UPI0035937271
MLRPCADGRLPDVHPSWTTPRSRWSGPRWSKGQAHGFEADLWTLERVGAVVTRATGVVLSRASVWRLLTGRLGWSLQRPERRAVERDESEIARWIAHEWPRIKKGP